MRIGLVVAALTLLFAQSAWAKRCPRGDSKWTDTESEVWRMLCAGHAVDITPPYSRMEPPLAGQPLPPNVLSAAFLQTILTAEPYASAAPFVHITGAMVTGVFDVTGAAIRADVLFYDSHFLGGVALDDMAAAGTWAFVHSYVPGPFRARRARIGGGFSLAESFAGEGVDLSSLAVGGNVVLRYLEAPTLTAPGLSAKAQLDLEHATVAGGEIVPRRRARRHRCHRCAGGHSARGGPAGRHRRPAAAARTDGLERARHPLPSRSRDRRPSGRRAPAGRDGYALPPGGGGPAAGARTRATGRTHGPAFGSACASGPRATASTPAADGGQPPWQVWRWWQPATSPGPFGGVVRRSADCGRFP